MNEDFVVLLIIARAEVEVRLAGYQVGSYGYLNKPTPNKLHWSDGKTL